MSILAKHSGIVLVSAVVVIIIAYALRSTDRTSPAQDTQLPTETGLSPRTNVVATRQVGLVPTSTGVSRTPDQLQPTAIVENGVTNWTVLPQPSRRDELATILEQRRAYAEEGRMQDIARREAELAEKSRLLHKGMTVAETLDVMGPPDAVEVIVEEPVEHSIRVVRVSLEKALVGRSTVRQLVYTPFRINEDRPLLPTIRPPPGPYLFFELYFGFFPDEGQGLFVWTVPYEDEFAQLEQEAQ